ncbi:MAG: hypothetical protein JWN78_3024 [Bacteroidota bacterium]|nr:hypothetical protein [Bacteroidota bacterium]
MAKKIIKYIGILLGALLLLSLAIKLMLPFYWGDSTQTVKYEFYKKNADKFNAVYLGGSLEYRHIDPTIVDSIAQHNGIDLRSFNIAVDGHGLIQELTDLDGLLKIHNPNLKYIFFSISSDAYFFPANLHTSKWVSWHDATSTCRALRVILTSKDDLKSKTKFSWFYTMSWMENLFKIGMMPDVLNFYVNKDKYDKSYLGKLQNGFYPYDYEENHMFMEYKWEDTLIRQSKHEYENNPARRDSLTNDVLQSFENYKGDEKPNKAMVNLCMEAYKKCMKRGIQVFFILPPKGRISYDILLPVFNAMPEGTKIELADPRKYPKYYKADYGYNFHHLNYKGAKLQSYDMAKQLVALMKADSI